AEKLEQQIKKDPASINYAKFWNEVFYGVSYPDYLFSLPMGAGKTFLMAAFIYLDLYFAQTEPENPAFAHNFMIFAPSGLKSSVVPSLRTIQKFDPAWVIPEPAASEVRRSIVFEVLDQSKTASKSNKTKNPDVQKIALHQPLSELYGLVAVTNAEKVILDRIQEKDGQFSFFEESDDERDRQANELRNLIGKLPALSIFIDEVHHATSEDIKLRAVVNRWAAGKAVNSVIGFSGTPYLEKPGGVSVTDKLKVAAAEITNVVYYYPLINGVGNFLKRPVVKLSDMADSARIIEDGVRSFLDAYKDTVYPGGLSAKLGIYCGTIEKLEELVYPLVLRVAAEYGLAPECILKFHKGNKRYPQSADSQLQFDTLDSPVSGIRIVLLVQIGKEGWDCRSLTGIILSQEGDCPKIMVLQASCRCLRQVVKGAPETALIYLNESNADILNAQLRQQQRISLKEFASAEPDKTALRRYNRMDYLKLPKIEYYQLKINYRTICLEEPDPASALEAAAKAEKTENIVRTTDLTMAAEATVTEVVSEERGDAPAVFTAWLRGLFKSSFGFIAMPRLKEHEALLRGVFDKITYLKEGSRFYSSLYDRAAIEADVRKAFYEKRDFSTLEELVPNDACLLNIANFTSEIHAADTGDYYPDQTTVENIVLDDRGQLKMEPAVAETIKLLEAGGDFKTAEILRRKSTSHPQKDRSFHYLPYRTDSGFEQTFLKEVLTLKEIEDYGLEVYYNGDRAMTEFKIKCYKECGGKRRYIGVYTPDFLIIKRRYGKIHKAIIVETKGEVYSHDPSFKDKRLFMEAEFAQNNNAAFGYERFQYLYLEDTLSQAERIKLAHKRICEFFKSKE
ncbi:MAG: DEAD/DEAH box helicase family protein, partial [Oscillospiraceae bacterium]|nr:DEAD/DEAH box helicase family protein [Oscillospiraceae bacterium]